MKTRPTLPLLVILLLLVSAPVPTRLRAMNAPAPSQCNDLDAKANLYQKFLDNFKGTVEQQKVAYEVGKEYIARYGDCPDKADKKVAAYVRRWVAAYEAAVREWERQRQ